MYIYGTDLAITVIFKAKTDFTTDLLHNKPLTSPDFLLPVFSQYLLKLCVINRNQPQSAIKNPNILNF